MSAPSYSMLPAGVDSEAERAGLSPDRPSDLAQWLFSRAAQLHAPSRRYAVYLKLMDETFTAIAELFDLQSPPGSKGTKDDLRLTRVEDMLHIANQLYVLDAAGVEGCLLECGCAHGFSTCCLSHACSFLGRELKVADSFEGLPAVVPEEKVFRTGDYAAGLEEVKENVEWMGRGGVNAYIKGWYAQSLVGWNKPIALLWMDVDLYESACDLMAQVFESIDRRGAIFSHEFTDFEGRPLPKGERNVPSAIKAAFDRSGEAYAEHALGRWFGMAYFSTTERPDAPLLLPAMIERTRSLDPRSRYIDELRASGTYRLGRLAKRVLMPWKS